MIHYSQNRQFQVLFGHFWAKKCHFFRYFGGSKRVWGAPHRYIKNSQNLGSLGLIFFGVIEFFRRGNFTYKPSRSHTVVGEMIQFTLKDITNFVFKLLCSLCSLIIISFSLRVWLFIPIHLLLLLCQLKQILTAFGGPKRKKEKSGDA